MYKDCVRTKTSRYQLVLNIAEVASQEKVPDHIKFWKSFTIGMVRSDEHALM